MLEQAVGPERAGRILESVTGDSRGPSLETMLETTPPARLAARATCETASANAPASASTWVPPGSCSPGKSSAGSNRSAPSYAEHRIRACD